MTGFTESHLKKAMLAWLTDRLRAGIARRNLLPDMGILRDGRQTIRIEEKKMKMRAITADELEEVFSYLWAPVQLVGDAIPDIFQNMPGGLANSVFASGSYSAPRPLPLGVAVAAGELIGGIDVYRNAPDDPVELNRDWYPIIRNPNTGILYIVTAFNNGNKDHEHWLDKVPDRLEGATVLGLQSK